MAALNAAPFILVVDDEPDITAIYAMYLNLHGYEVLTADNPLQALGIIAKRIPDLIISDLMMPHMDGIEFSIRVKADPVTKDTPIILTSGAPERHDLASQSYEVFLRKPVRFDRLMPEIRRLLQRPEAGRRR